MNGSQSPWLACSPPAKLNLFLEVCGRRADRFHELDMVMVAVDWRDELRLRRTSRPDIDLRAQWLPSRDAVADSLGLTGLPAGDPRWSLLDVPADARNLVHRALAAVSESLELTGGWEVELGKRIPTGAGMGGGSSDAAAVIRMATTLIAEEKKSFPTHAIHDPVGRRAFETDVALRIGSDVPFFLHPEAACRAQGRGEILTDVSLAETLHFAVFYPPEPMPTADVYRGLALAPGQMRPTAELHSADEIIVALQQGASQRLAALTHNALQPVACGLSSRVQEALQCFEKVGVRTAMMTGSGSACFALFETAQQAMAVATQLRHAVGRQALIQAVSSCPASSPFVYA